MAAESASRLTVRDAGAADIPALTAIKGPGSEAIHLDRLRDALEGSFRYLVLVVGEDLVGFCCLVMRRPSHWSDANDTGHLPQMVDLRVAESFRGQGYGTAFIHAIEQIAAQQGHDHLFLCVEPLDNPRAYALYQRLGYHALQTEPRLEIWEFTDSQGTLHRGEEWIVDMVKPL